MRVKVFLKSARTNAETEILKRFGVGIQHEFSKENGKLNSVLSFDKFTGRGNFNSVEYDYSEKYSDCDVAIIFGSWKDRGAHHLVRTSVAEQATCFVCLESQLLDRKTHDNFQYYRIGVNGFLNGSAFWNAENCPPDRYNNLDLGDWEGWRENYEGHILIALQLPGDASMRGNSIVDWCLDTIRTIRNQTDRPIVIRTHPIANDKKSDTYYELIKAIAFNEFSNVTLSNGKTSAIERDFAGAYCTVTYSSGLAIDSIRHGIPVIACDPGNFAWNISSKFPDEVLSPQKADYDVVQQWFYNLAYCQWTVEEMQNGKVWRHLVPAITKANGE